MPLSSIAFQTVPESDHKEPAPGEKKRRGRPPGSGTGTQFKTQLTDEFDSLLKLLAMVWSTRDPICAPILNEQSTLIATDLADLASRSKWARKYLTQMTQLGAWMPLFLHLQPVLMAIHAHHVAPRFERERPPDDTGYGPLV